MGKRCTSERTEDRSGSTMQTLSSMPVYSFSGVCNTVGDVLTFHSFNGMTAIDRFLVDETSPTLNLDSKPIDYTKVIP